MDKRAWIIFVVAVGALFVGLVAFSRQSSIDVSTYNNAKPITKQDKPESAIADHVYGLKDSKVTLIEYGDMQCPGCGNLHKTIEPLLEDYKDKITFVFRNFPLTQLHPNARSAASAAEAAGLQGKYWEMNNLLYNNQSAWENLDVKARDSQFTEYATQLGLKKDQFKEDFASDKVAKKINFDQALGKEHEVNATPTLFLNGKKLDTKAYEDADALKATLDNAIHEAGVDTKDKK